MKVRFAALVLILACSGSAVASSDYACDSAISSYNTALESIGSTNRRYISCVSNSRGSDDCSFEFRRLKSAQWDFEMAVSSYGTSCKP